MSLELKGKLIHVGDIQTFDSGFKKRVIVIETDDRYPQQVPFELLKDGCDLINGYELNSELNVHFNVRGNEYNGKYYCNLHAWKLDGEQKKSNDTPSFKPITPPADNNTPEVDDLPF